MQWSQLSVGCDFQVPLHSDAIRYGWDGIASDSQVELVNQPPTCRQLRKGKSLESGRTAVSYQKWNNPMYFLLNPSCVHLLGLNLAPGSFFSHRKHWITLCVFQQINSEQRLRCQPHQRDQSSQRFVDTLHIGIQPMTKWLPTSWWFRLCRKNPFHKPSKTAKTKQNNTTLKHPMNQQKSTTLYLQKSLIMYIHVIHIMYMTYVPNESLDITSPPPPLCISPWKPVFFPTFTVLTTWHH